MTETEQEKNKYWVENLKFLTLEDYEQAINELVFNANSYSLASDFKRRFIEEAIKRHNVLNIKKHYIDNSCCNENYKAIYQAIPFNFKTADSLIKAFFSKYTKDDRIKEILPYVCVEKIKEFNKDKQKYFSIWDFNKTATPELIKKVVFEVKKLPLEARNLSDHYRAHNFIKELGEFLKLAYDIDINTTWEYAKQYKDYEKQANDSTDKIKIELCADWYYLKFTNAEQETDFRNRLINEMVSRLERSKKE